LRGIEGDGIGREAIGRAEVKDIFGPDRTVRNTDIEIALIFLLKESDLLRSDGLFFKKGEFIGRDDTGRSGDTVGFKTWDTGDTGHVEVIEIVMTFRSTEEIDDRARSMSDHREDDGHQFAIFPGTGLIDIDKMGMSAALELNIMMRFEKDIATILTALKGRSIEGKETTFVVIGKATIFRKVRDMREEKVMENIFSIAEIVTEPDLIAARISAKMLHNGIDHALSFTGSARSDAGDNGSAGMIL
jgi:hypothetical protein